MAEVFAEQRPTSALHGRRLNVRPAVNHLHGLTCAGVQGASRPQSHSGQQIAADAHATLPRFELTGRTTRDSSDPEDLKQGVLSSGEAQC